ncbi:MAG: Crp/Fnr family transcriptional regulator, partial [Rhodoferax sp.]
MALGQMLYEPGSQLRHAYFPTNSIVSLHYVTATGASAEAAGVGNEGVVGISLFMGGNTTSSSAVVQTAGHAYRLDARLLQQEFNRAASLQGLLLRYTHALMTQMSQTAVCNRHHTVEQQFCRWLLLTLDRLPSHELVVTHELVGNMLGVRRESVTEAAGGLQRAGFISSRRGHVAVLDRSGLERQACECYGVVKKEWDRLLSDKRPATQRAEIFIGARSVNQSISAESACVSAPAPARNHPRYKPPAPAHDAAAAGATGP